MELRGTLAFMPLLAHRGLEDHAARVLDTLDDATPRELRRLSAGLQAADWQLSSLGAALTYLANDRENGKPPSSQTLITTQVGLKMAASAELRGQLKAAHKLDPFWRAVRKALRAA